MAIAKEEFIKLATAGLKQVQVFNNPSGKGTSIIQCVNNESITYRRANSKITVKFDALYKAYKEFSGKDCTSNDLKRDFPDVFDSFARPSGHSCNCTFFFMLLKLEKLGLVNNINGRGVAGDPFWVHIEDCK